MKKLISILLMALCIICLTGCIKSYEEVSKEKEEQKLIQQEQKEKEAYEILEKQENEINERINNFNEEEKIVFNEKFQEYSKTMKELKAKYEAIRDIDVYNSKVEYRKKRAEDIEKSHKEIESKNNITDDIEKQKDSTTSKSKGIDYVEADINILISDAKNNAARANRAYNGKYVKIVGGYVHNIESDGDYISLSCDGSYSLLHVQCFPQNSEVREQIFNLNKGQYVTVYGRISKVGEIVGYRLEMHKIE